MRTWWGGGSGPFHIWCHRTLTPSPSFFSLQAAELQQVYLDWGQCLHGTPTPAVPVWTTGNVCLAPSQSREGMWPNWCKVDKGNHTGNDGWAGRAAEWLRRCCRGLEEQGYSARLICVLGGWGRCPKGIKSARSALQAASGHSYFYYHLCLKIAIYLRVGRVLQWLRRPKEREERVAAHAESRCK